MTPRLPSRRRPTRAFFAWRLALIAAAHGLLGSAALARPLSNEEAQTLRAAPPFGQSDKVPDGLKRLQAAQALAHRLGMEGNADAVPLLVELRQTQLLNAFAGSYSGPTTPELEALALRYMDDPEIASRLVALLRQPRSPALFDALLQQLPAGKIDCDLLLRAAAGAEVPDVEPRLARLLPALHPAFARHIAQRFADREYLAGEKPLIELLRRTPLTRWSPISGIATQLVRLPSDAALNAVARKLIEIAALPEDKTPPRLGLQFSIRSEDIPRDGLLCSTELLRVPHPLQDARSREVAELLRILRLGFPEATLERSIFAPAALAPFSPDERQAVDAMLADRSLIEARARELTPENLTHWILASVDTRMVKRFVARGIDVNRPTAMGERPLVLAARTVRADSVALLLDAGADPNLPELQPRREGNAALHAVSGHGGTVAPVIDSGVRIMKLLLARKADPGGRNSDGATPLQIAAGPRPELAALLLEAGAPVNAADRHGSTPLHRAVQGRHRALVRQLLDRGANVNAEEMGGVTPLLIARDMQDRELESLLASRGGRINQAYYLKREAFKLLYTLPRGGH